MEGVYIFYNYDTWFYELLTESLHGPFVLLKMVIEVKKWRQK